MIEINEQLHNFLEELVCLSYIENKQKYEDLIRKQKYEELILKKICKNSSKSKASLVTN